MLTSVFPVYVWSRQFLRVFLSFWNTPPQGRLSVGKTPELPEPSPSAFLTLTPDILTALIVVVGYLKIHKKNFFVEDLSICFVQFPFRETKKLAISRVLALLEVYIKDIFGVLRCASTKYRRYFQYIKVCIYYIYIISKCTIYDIIYHRR